MRTGAKRDLALRGSYAVQSGLLLDDLVMHRMRLFDIDAHYWIDLDHEELERRGRVGPVALPERYSLRLLASLPLGQPVSLAELPPYEEQLARQLPEGAVAIADGKITRLLRPAVAPRMTMVVDSDWERGINRAGQFSNFTTRTLVCTAGEIPALASVKAMSYGIGLVGVNPDRSLEVLVQPEPVEYHFGPITWLLQEEATAQLDLATQPVRTAA
jgi:hypothetical protein